MVKQRKEHIKPIRVNKTMHEEYGEPNDEAGKHLVCLKCGFCITCGDCRKFGCGDKRYCEVKREYDKTK